MSSTTGDLDLQTDAPGRPRRWRKITEIGVLGLLGKISLGKRRKKWGGPTALGIGVAAVAIAFDAGPYESMLNRETQARREADQKALGNAMSYCELGIEKENPSTRAVRFARRALQDLEGVSANYQGVGEVQSLLQSVIQDPSSYTSLMPKASASIEEMLNLNDNVVRCRCSYK